MAAEIDKRVVEMQFDNRDFEKNCQASLSTLEKLKMALNFDGAKGLESMGKAASKLDLSGIAKGAEAVEVKFNAMNIAGMTVVSELTKGFMNLGKTIWNVSFGQASKGGFARTLKIDQAKFQMKALAANLDEVKSGAKSVQQVMDGMLDAVDRAVTGTAYGYDAAAAVASQLMASGLTDYDKMYDHLRAIAGAAAMTGRSFEDIGNIFTTVASNGKLMTMQLRQFSASGLNLSATLAQQLGKTETEINDMVQHGQINFETFSNALSESFGEAAGKADETWSGVTSNVKAQLSRIGQLFTDPFVNNMIPVLASLKADIKIVRNALVPLGRSFETVFKVITKNAKNILDTIDVSRISTIVSSIDNMFATLVMVLDTLRKAFLEVFPKKTANELLDAAHQFEQFTRQLIPTQKTLNGLKATFKAILIPIRIVYNILKAFSKSVIRPLSLAILKLLGSFLRLAETLSPIIDGIVKTITEGNFLNEVFLTITATIIVVVNALRELIDAIVIIMDEVFQSVNFNILIQALRTIAEVIGEAIVTALRVVMNVVAFLFSFITSSNIVNLIHGIGGAIQFIIAIILLGINSIINIINGIAKSGTIIGDVFKVLKEIAGIIVDLISGKDISGRLSNLTTLINGIGNALKDLFEKLKEAMKKISASKLVLLAFGVAMIFVALSVRNLLEATTNLVYSANNFFGVFTTLKRTLKNLANTSTIIQTFIGLTVLIGILTASMQTLALIPSADLIRAAASLGVLVGAIVILAVALALLQKYLKEDFTKTVKNLSVMMISLAASVLVLSYAVNKLAEFSDKNWTSALIPLGMVIGMIAALSAIVTIMTKKMKDQNFYLKQSIFILSMALAIKMLGNVVVTLSSISIEKAKEVLLGMGVVIGLLVGLGAAAGLAGATKVGFGTMIGLIGFVATIKLLLVMTSQIAQMAEEEVEAISSGLKLLTKLIIKPLVLFLAACAALVKFSGSADIFGQLSKLFLGISAAMLVLVGGIAFLGSLNDLTLFKGVTTVVTVMLSLAFGVSMMMVALQGLKGVSDNAAVKSIEAMGKIYKAIGFSMLMFAAAAAIVSKVDDPLAMIQIMVIFIGVSVVVAILTHLSSKSSEIKIRPIIALMGMIAMLMGSLAVLSLGDSDKVLSAGMAIAIVLTAVGIILAALNDNTLTKNLSSGKMGKAQKQKEKTKQLLATAALMGAIAGVVVAIAAVFDIFSNVSKNLTSASATNFYIMIGALAIVLGAIGLFIIDISKFAKDARAMSVQYLKNMAKLILSLSGAVVIIAGSIAGLAVVSSMNVNWSTFVTSLIALATVLGVLGIVAKKLIYADTEDWLTENQMITAAKMIMALGISVAIIAASIAGLAVVSSMNVNWSTFVTSLIALATVLGVLGVIAKKIINYTVDGGMARKFRESAVSFVILSSSIAIISASIAGLAVTSALLDVNNTTFLMSLVALGIIISAMVGLMAIITKVDYKPKKVLLASVSFAILAGSITLIAGSIALLTKNNDLDSKVMGTFIGIIISLGIIFTILAALSSKINGVNMILVSTAFAILATAVDSILLALSALVAISSKYSDKDIDDVISILNKMLIVAGVIGLIGGVLGALAEGGIGTAILLGILTMSTAFGIFSTSVFLLGEAAASFANAIDTIHNAVIKFNSVELDSDRLKGNIKAVFDASASIIPQAIASFGEFLNQAVIVLGKRASDFAMLGVMFVFSFIDGINSKLGQILETVKSIMKQIIDFLKDDENMTMIQEFAEIVGDVILGVMKGVIKSVADMIWEDIIFPLQDAKNQEKEDKHATAVAKNDRNKAIEKLINYEDPRSYFDSRSLRRRMVDTQNDKHLVNIFDSLSDDELYYAQRMKNKRTEEEAEQFYKDMLQATNAELALRERTGRSVDEIIDAYKGLAQTLGLADQYVDSFEADVKSIYTGTLDLVEEGSVKLDKYGNAIADTASEYGTLTKEAQESSEAIADGVNKSTDAYENFKSTFGDNSFIQSGLDKVQEFFTADGGLFGFIQTSALGGGEKLQGAFSTIGSMLGNVTGISFNTELLNELDFGKISGDILSGNLDAASLLGMLTGEQQARAEIESYEEAIARYKKEGMEKIVTNQSAFDASRGGTGWEFKWQNEGYRSLEDYAEAMYQAQEQTSIANDILKDYLKIEDEVTDATDDLSDSVDGLGDSLGKMDKNLVKSSMQFGEFYNNLHDSMRDALKSIYDEVSEDDPIGTDEMLKRMEENTKKVGKWARQIQELAAKGMSEGLLNELKDMGPQAADKVDAFARMTSEQLERANQMYASKTKLPDYATDNIVESFEQAGYNASLGFWNGVDHEMVKQTFFDMGLESLKKLEESLDEHSPSKETYKRGKYAVEGFELGLKDPTVQSKIKSDVTQLAKDIMKRFEVGLSQYKMTQIARNLMQGLVNGLRDTAIIRNTNSAITSITSTILSRFKLGFNEHSPSKATQEMGLYLMQGLGLGMQDGTTLVERETGSTADDILQTMRDQLYGKLDGLGEDGVYQPVIRPVFDMSGLESGYLGIQEYMNSVGAIDINSNLSRITPTNRENNDLVQYDILNAIRAIDVDSITTEMQSLRTDISNLQQAMTNMQVVMDTGALVGQVVDPIDNVLGMKALVNGRGRY